MPNTKDLIGTRVFVPDLDQFGKVVSVTPHGIVSEVAVETPEGEKVISVLDRIVLITKTIAESGFIDLIVSLFKAIFR